MSDLCLTSSRPDVLKPSVFLLADGPTAHSAFRSLVKSCNVLGVFRTGGEAMQDPVRLAATEHGIPLVAIRSLRDLQHSITKQQPDAVVISSFGRIIRSDILATTLFINVHYAPLPRYRGRANVNWAIINGEETAAVTIHLVSPGLDDGNILFQEQCAIAPTDTAHSLYECLNAIQERELGDAVIRAVAGDPGSIQNNHQASFACARVPDDGEIDWRNSSDSIDRLIRALSPPFPGAFTHLELSRLVVARAEPRAAPPRYDGRVPGRVVGRSPREGWVDVLTGDGILRLFEIISESSAATPAATIIRSTRSTLGLSRLELLQRIDALERRLAALETIAYPEHTGSRTSSEPDRGARS